jgi:hypothetical protein
MVLQVGSTLQQQAQPIPQYAVYLLHYTQEVGLLAQHRQQMNTFLQ